MNRITLHPVKRTTAQSNRFCGPAAISILTGIDTRETARLLRHVSGKRSIKGTSTHHLSHALTRLGFGIRPWDVVPKGAYKPAGNYRAATLIRYLKDSREARGSDTFLIVAGHHYCVVQGRRYCCGQTKAIVPFAFIPHRKARIEEVYKVLRMTARVVTSAVPPLPPRAALVLERIEAKRLAATHGIRLTSISMCDRLDPDNDGVYVEPPTGLYHEDDDTDPYEGCHGCFSWPEVLEHVNAYVAVIKAKAEPALGCGGEPVTFVQS